MKKAKLMLAKGMILNYTLGFSKPFAIVDCDATRSARRSSDITRWRALGLLIYNEEVLPTPRT